MLKSWARFGRWRSIPFVLTIPLCVLAASGSLAQRPFGATGPTDPRPITTAPLGEQRQPEAPTGSISGLITALGTGEPLAGANVEALRAECGSNTGERASTKTGDDGHYKLEKLRAGVWCVGAAHPSGAYTPVEYHQRNYLGRGLAVRLTEAQTLESIDMVMAPTGSISGRVLDDDGEPMARARVQVMRATFRDGERRLYSMNVVQTNDRGEFHFFWLPPDRYFIAAIPEDTDRQRAAYSVAPPGAGGYRADALPPVIRRRNTRDGETIEETYLPVYFGGGVDASRAQPIDIRPAESINAIQLTFNGARKRAWHIRGKVPPIAPTVAAAGAPTGPGAAFGARGGQQNPPPPPAAQLRLAPKEWTSLAVMPYATADMEGNFDIAGVVPGSYVLYATVQNQLARIPIEVGNADIEDLLVVPVPAFPLSGRLVVENPSALAQPVDPSSWRVVLARNPDLTGIPGVSTVGTVGTDSIFTLEKAPPGDYRVYILPFLPPTGTAERRLPTAFEKSYVKAIRLGGLDVLKEGLHLTSTPEEKLEIVLGLGGGLEGTVMDVDQNPVIRATVALVPFGATDRPDLYRVATSDRFGHFQIRGVAPGSYNAFAWDGVAEGAWFDEEFIRTSGARARPVQIGEGVESTTELVISR
ncbi:MAG TPA: carboxypeptidase-like regulatory domain-containing protein [Terriglobia bacterium]|nr:carboxypeptidase-like regulatory domain-containing protein [Terriglobia bacterium]